MYCTGGIRCEKASSYLIKNGFNDVNQLQGGIIQYTHEIKSNNMESKFRGKNFVFDDRLGERITDDVLSFCHICGESCDDHTDCKNDACHILFIQCEKCKKLYNGCCSKECKILPLYPLNSKRNCVKIQKELYLEHFLILESNQGWILRLSLPILYSFRRCPYAMRARMGLAYSQISYDTERYY